MPSKGKALTLVLLAVSGAAAQLTTNGEEAKQSQTGQLPNRWGLRSWIGALKT